jgi:hypothetical protein
VSLNDVSVLKTVAAHERERVAKTIASLNKKFESGGVRSMLVAYFDADGALAFVVNDHMTIQQFTYALAHLQAEMLEMMRKQGDRLPPEDIE